jgi:ATP-dependent Clp protease ATP-binding subunit ClpB
VKTGYDPVYGARPLERAIQHELETPLPRDVLAGELHDGDHVAADYDEGSGRLTLTARPARVPAPAAT